MTHRLIEDQRPVAFFPGSFNPFTRGHMSLLTRFLPLFSRIIIGIGINSEKNNENEDIKERIEKIKSYINNFANVDVIYYDGLTVQAAKKSGATYIIRGIRDIADFEYEKKIADINRQISGIETIIMFTLPEYSSVSSSMVRELEKYGEDISNFIP